MKTITISTENSETYSSISNFFIDYYMTEANGEFVKVYLYLVRLLNSSEEVSVAGIADHFNLTENDICRAIKYWISRDVLKLNYDGKGHLNGIVLLPLHAPILDLKMESDAVSILKVSSVVKPEKEEMVARPKVVHMPAPQPEENTDLVAPAKPDFSKQEIMVAFEDENLSDIQYYIETLFGKPLTQSNYSTVLYIYDTLGFSIDLFEFLVDYCVEMKKMNFRYMEAVAIAWFKDGIKTRQEAKEQTATTKTIYKVIFKALGIRRSTPTDTEVELINTWSKDYGFSEALIKTACDKAILAKPGSANFNYVNAILENWHRNNVKTLEDVENLDKAFAAKSARKGTGATVNVNGFNNFNHSKTDSDLEEMEKLLLKEVNS
ncbi:MAG: DnaD domain protein [Lachnospiraceae bacterium]|nr:DnaD domain protein [Lachnospiraceae bacterium]